MFKQLGIKGKMMAGFGFVILVALSVASMAIYSMMNSSEVGKEIRRLITEDVADVFEVNVAYGEVHSWLHELQVAPSPSLVRAGLEKTHALSERVQKGLPMGRFNDLSNACINDLNNLVRSIENSQFKTLLEAGRYEEADKVFLKEVLPYSSSANRNLSNLIYSYSNEVTNYVIELDMTHHIYTTLVLTLIGTIVAVIFATLLSKYIVGSTLNILEYAKLIEYGNFNINIDQDKIHNDEIGRIYRCFKDIAHTLNRAIARTIAISESLNTSAQTLNTASNAVIKIVKLSFPVQTLL